MVRRVSTLGWVGFMGVISLCLIGGCIGTCEQNNEGEGTQSELSIEQQDTVSVPAVKIKALPPHITQGEELVVQIEGEIDATIDSVTVAFTQYGAWQRIQGSSFSIPTDEHTLVGIQSVRVASWLRGHHNMQTQRIEIFPRTSPHSLSYKVKGRYPHAKDAYTQGLLLYQGQLYESTGQRGESSLRVVDIQSGKVVHSVGLSSEYFAEGLARIGKKLYQLTWTSRQGFIYNVNTLEQVGQFHYPTEGWGLEAQGDTLYLSDGSHQLYLLRAQDFTLLKTLQVYSPKGPQSMLNELEFIDGILYANVYLSDKIVGINPKTGAVETLLDLSDLHPTGERGTQEDVLNGLAYDPATGALYVTGKYWPWLYELSFTR